MSIFDTNPFFLRLTDFLFVLVRNVSLLVVNAVANVGLFMFSNRLFSTVLEMFFISALNSATEEVNFLHNSS